jgi:hypothetical protein
MQLIDNWKDAWKLSSVQAGAVITALGVAEQVLPALQAALPTGIYAILGALVMIARVVLQPKLSK